MSGPKKTRRVPEMVSEGDIPRHVWNTMARRVNSMDRENGRPESPEYSPRVFKDVVLEEDLAAPADTTSYTEAEAAVYFGFKDNYDTTGEIIVVTNRNPSLSLSIGDYVTVGLMRSGEWRPLGSGGGAAIVRFTVTTADCDVDPKSAVVNVDAIVCSGASVAVDDSITVYDKAGCFLNQPEADLAGRVGFAVKLDDTAASGECDWEVFQMCCPINQCS